MEKIYTLRSHGTYGFYTGRTPDGRQVLLGRDWNALVAVFFDGSGSVAGFEERHFDREGSFTGEVISEQPLLLSEHAQGLVGGALKAWTRELKLNPGPISVEEFDLFDEGRFVGIAELPSHLEDYLEDPTEYDESEASELAQDLEEWRASGDFMFWWNEEYGCSPDGRIHSS